MFGKKKNYGHKPKVRTLAEINQDYQHHAIQYGHKARVIHQLQEELEQHLQQMCIINDESTRLPKEELAKAVQETGRVEEEANKAAQV